MLVKIYEIRDLKLFIEDPDMKRILGEDEEIVV